MVKQPIVVLAFQHVNIFDPCFSNFEFVRWIIFAIATLLSLVKYCECVEGWKMQKEHLTQNLKGACGTP
jgi:hypothetical protein